MANIIRIGGGGSTPTLITKSITQNGTYYASDDGADGYSEVEVNVSGGGTAVTQFRYIKWHITANGGAGYFQVSEFGFCDTADNLMTFPQGMSATSSLPLLSGYSIPNLFDGSTNTKIVTEWHSGDIEDITIDFGSGNEIDITDYPYYYWGSSDDDQTYVGRVPLKWQLLGANQSDFSDAVLLDEVTNFSPLVKNQEMAYRGLMVSPIQSGGSELHLLYSLEQTQGGQWFNTGINTTQYDKLLFINSVNGDDGYMREIAISDIIVVNSGTANDYTEVFSAGAIGKMFICHIYNNELWVGYNASGSSGNVVSIYHETGEIRRYS